jgi:PAS domain S-box-containing protein
MACQPPFGDLEPPCSERPNQELGEEPSPYGSELEEKSLVNLISERTSDLVAITTFCLSPRYVYISPSNKRILGYDPSDLLNKCPFDFIHPDDLPRLSPLLEKYVTSLSQPGKASAELKLPTERLLYRFKDKSGNWRSLETTGDLIADDRILFISRDVTERVKAEHDLYESRMLLQTEVEKRTRELTSANKALRESERKYRNILESIEDGYYEVDLGGNLTFFNPALCRITGYSPEELHGMNNREYQEPKTAKRMYEIFNRVYRTGEPSKVDAYEVIKKDGTKAMMELSTSLMRKPSGEAIGFRGIVRDITKRRLIEKALAKSEEKYRTILQNIEDGYYEVDLRGNMVFFNESMCRILGFSDRELKGMNNRQFMSEETSKKVFQTFHQVYLTGESTKVLGWEMIRKDGEKRYFETIVSLIRGSQGEPIGFGGIARDVTELWLARKSVEESEKKYRTILHGIEEGYFEVDIKGNFVFFNESMCKILGYTDQELKGMNNRHFMSEETSKKVFQTFNQVYRSGDPAKALGWELIMKDGERRYVETSVSLIRNPKGEAVGFRGVARDITESKRLEKAKERAINHLSHELGTPLSIIGGALNRMPEELRKGNMERVYGWIERMKRNIGRLSDLQAKIEDILNEKPVREKERILSIIETAIAFLDELKDEPLKEGGEAVRQSIVKRLESLHKVEESRKETIVLDAFISQVCQEARLCMKNRDLEIVEKIERGIAVEMDPKVLKKVCEGFLKNAIENTPDEGRIEIELHTEGNLAKICFHDFGMGITPENQKLIFSGFFHTQDTDRYASKMPYLFNAGGTGSDLLRARVLSDRFGFSVDFSSTRCRHLPSDKDECPGSISSCPYVKGKEDCLTSGGSNFFVCLPLQKPSQGSNELLSL